MATIFTSPIFTEMILPFLLVFVLVFAILQKSKVLGEGKSQIDALVSLAIGLILIVFPTPRDIVVNITPWLGVGVVVMLVFMILYGFVAGDLSKADDWMKITFGILAGLFTIGVVIYVTGLYKVIGGWVSGGDSDIWANVIMIILVVGAMAVAVFTGKKKADK